MRPLLPRLTFLALCLAACSLPRGVKAPPRDPPQGPKPPTVYIPDEASLELHTHLFMKQGMGPVVHGGFEGPLRAKDWTSQWGSQANADTLDQSQIGLLVLAMYAHPVFTSFRRKASIRKQIALAERFCFAHPNWTIAKSPAQARAALALGRRVIVLALEHAYGVLDECNLNEFVDNLGIRIVTFLHISDDPYGGAAFLPGPKTILNPAAWVPQSLHPTVVDHVHVNRRGLTPRGRRMAEKLMRRGVWLDLSHASDASAKDIIQMHEEAGLPVLFTHTALRKYLGAERGIAGWEVEAVARTHGIVGLLPSEEFLGASELSPGTCSRDCKLPCAGGIQALATQFKEITTHLPPEAIALGSDYNGGVKHLHPGCAVGTALDAQGLWNIGLASSVWESLEKLHAPVPTPHKKTVDYFLDAWERVTAHSSADDSTCGAAAAAEDEDPNTAEGDENTAGEEWDAYR